MSDFFNLQRLLLFIKSDLIIKKRSMMIFVVTTFAVLFLYDILFSGYRQGFHNALYSVFLFCGGFIVTSRAFSDLHDKTQGIAFLTLPASLFEKLFGRWLIASVGYAIYMLLLFFLVFMLAALYGRLFVPVNWHEILDSLKYYLLLQPVFLLGAIYFKKSALTKTILCWCFFVLALFFIKFLLVAVFFIQDRALQQFFTWQNYQFFALNGFLLLLAPTCLFITYLRLCESEI